MKAKNVRSGFSMIELVFVIVILGVLAAVAVPRFVATRTDAQVATARSDMASAQKAIVAKIFADNIDSTQSQAPDPNAKAAGAAYDMNWGDWIIEVAGLDGGRWSLGGGLGIKVGWLTINGNEGRTVQPIGNIKSTQTAVTKGGCGDMLGIQSGYMVFAPNNINEGTHMSQDSSNFCYALRKSYESSGGPGNKVVPLASSGTVEF